MKKKKNTSNIHITIATWVIVVGLWYAVTEFKIVNSVMLPSPVKVIETFARLLTEGYNKQSFAEHLGISLFRLLSATTAALFTAIPLGLFSGYFGKFRAAVDSFIQFYRPLPPLAYYTLLIMWMGIGEGSKIMLLYLAAFAPIYLACLSAVGSVKSIYILHARSMGASERQIFFKVVLPASLPQIFVGIRTAFGFAYTTLVSAEMVAATAGIGWMVLDASKYLKSDVIFVGIIVMGLTGLLINYGLIFIEDRIVFWKGKS